MAAIAEVISTTNAVELLSVVWMEVTMASLAAMVWFTVSGVIVMPKAQKKANRSSPPCSGDSQPGQQGKRSPRSSGSAEQSNLLQLANKALRQGRLSEAVALLQQLPETVDGHIPASVAPRLLMAVAKAQNFDEAMTELKLLVGKIEARALEAAVLEAVKNKDLLACRQLLALSAPMEISKSPRTLEALARAHKSDLPTLSALVEEAEAPLPKGFAGAVLEACAALREVDLVLDVFEKAAEEDAAALRVIAEKASKSSNSPAADKSSKPEVSSDSKDAAGLAREIRARGKDGDLKGALKIFDRSPSQNLNAVLYNAILEACVQCANFNKAVAYFKQAETSGLVDVVSYNIMMKSYLAQGDETSAAQLLTKITEKGLAASHGSFHGLLNARVNARDINGAWKLVEQMQAAGLAPNMVTCSILLKNKSSTAAEVSRVLALMDSTQEQCSETVDDVLFASVIEACVRTNCLDLLSKYTEKFANKSVLTFTASTYGSMIKAYGQAWDLKKVWSLWEDMENNQVKPTSITLGCMVEAVVSNYCTDDAWQLVQKMWSQEDTRPLVNTVIYSTILKGFANAKDVKKVMTLYEEMRSHGVQPNTITYNTMLNAFAQGGAMDRVPKLLEDMKEACPPVEPDIVTYSTLVKGFCNSGSLDRALSVLRDVQASGKFEPDEVMYNSLLDGCAKEHRPDDALKLLSDMKKSGVAPSNYTLSMLVKLMGRCRRLEQAFTLIEEISQEFGLKVNIQVYTCLIQACFNNRQANKAIALHDKIVKDGALPDEMTYTVLVRGCLQAGLVDKAVQMTKCAHGVGLPKIKGTPPGVGDRCLAELMSTLGNKDARALQAELSESKVATQGGKGSGGKGKSRGNDWQRRS